MKFLVFMGLLVVAQCQLAPLLTVKEPIPGQYIIMLKEGVKVDDFVSSLELSSLGYGVAMEIKHKYQFGLALRFPDEKVDLLRKLEGVKYVEQDGVVYADAVGSWGLDRIDQREASLDNTYTYTNDGTGVDVYVIDSGINYSHQDLGGRADFFFDPIGGEDPPGQDCNGHGSHCSGTVGGNVYGVAKDVNLWACRTLSCSGSGSKSDSIAALDKIRTERSPPGVVSMSLGGSVSQAQNDAVDACVDAGFVVSVSAGNDNGDACNKSPASAPKAITVGSTDKDTDQRSSFSNYGECVDIFAPGRSIVSIGYTSDTSTATKSGTSMACPHVSGVAAKIFEANPTWTATRVGEEIKNTATPDVVGKPGNKSPNLLLYSR